MHCVLFLCLAFSLSISPRLVVWRAQSGQPLDQASEHSPSDSLVFSLIDSVWQDLS